jgi:hypothetical protein
MSPGLKPGAASKGVGEQAAPLESVCPKSSPPSKELYAIRITELDTVGRLAAYPNQPDQRLPLSCLQGMVNRQQPQLYLVFDRYDELWLEWLRKRGDIDQIHWVRVRELYERFLPWVGGSVVTDPDVPATVNVATMLAGLRGWLPVPPELLPGFDLKVAIDLRGRWKKNIEAYRWFYSTYGSELSQRLCANLDPAVHELRDYLVEFRVPLVWVSGPQDSGKGGASPEDEESFLKDFFLKLPPNIPCLGWWDHGQAGEEGIGEGPGVEIASQYGKFEVCTAWDGWAHPVSNLSIHSGTSATFRQKIHTPPPLAGKVYVTFTRTDGDGANFWRHVYRNLWDQPDRGKVAIGWQLGPTAFDLMPDMIDYFYRHATENDVFLNALTGIGYIREDKFATELPEAEREAVWKNYMSLSSRYFKLFDFSGLTTFQEMRPEVLNRLTSLPGLKGIYANYGRSEETTVENQTFEVMGIPVFRTISGGANGATETRVGLERAVASVVQDAHRFTPKYRPAFLEVSLTNWMVEMSALVEIEKALGSEYKVVRPDDLAALYKVAKGAS